MLDWLRDEGDDTSDGGDSPGEDLLGEADWDDQGGEDDLEFDEFGDDDETSIDELTNRVDSFEEEVGSMSSTVNTIKHENAEMGEELSEVKDNVRKLLEIYEMVTRGVNPFADDDPFVAGGEGSSFDLFDSSDDDVDTNPDPVPDTEDLLEDDFDDMDGFELDDGFDEDLDEEESTGGRSFDELKEEYDSGDAAWDDEGPEADDEPGVDDHELEEIAEPDAGEEYDDGDSPDQANSEEVVRPVGYNAADTNGRSAGVLGEKPYLRTLPDGYTTDLVIMQWMSELASYDDESAADTIEYYRAIGWIANEVAEELQAYAPGIAAVEIGADPCPSSTIPFEAHKISLQYIHKLATTSTSRVVLTESPDSLEDLLELDPSALEGNPGGSMQSARTDGGGFWAGIEGFDGWPLGSYTNEGV